MSLDNRMVFLARAIIARDLLVEPDRDPELEQYADFARKYAERTGGHNDLVSYLKKLTETTEFEKVEHLFTGLASREPIRRFHAALSGISCSDCAARAIEMTGQNVGVCDILGQDEALNGEAYCLTIIADFFQNAVRLADKIYESHVPDALGDLRIELQTRLAKDRFLNGGTRFPVADTVGGRQAVVTVLLPVHDFDEVHFGALFYLLFHEVFVHAPEAWASVGIRTPSDTGCSLREGFMDAAAYSILVKELNRNSGLLPSSVGSKVFWFVAQSRLAHSGRHEADADPSMPEHKIKDLTDQARRKAEAAAAFQMLEECYGHEAAIEFAVKLNVQDLSLTDKKIVMYLIEHGLPEVGIAPLRESTEFVQLYLAVQSQADNLPALLHKLFDKNDF